MNEMEKMKTSAYRQTTFFEGFDEEQKNKEKMQNAIPTNEMIKNWQKKKTIREDRNRIQQGSDFNNEKDGFKKRIYLLKNRLPKDQQLPLEFGEWSGFFQTGASINGEDEKGICLKCEQGKFFKRTDRKFELITFEEFEDIVGPNWEWLMKHDKDFRKIIEARELKK